MKNFIKQKLRESIDNQYLLLQRCQQGQIDDVWDFNSGVGQHGDGIYAYLYGDKAMANYYCKNGENTHTFKIDKKYVKDLSNTKLDYWDIKAFIYNNPNYKAFIFKHKGQGIPTSKEILITDPSIIIL